MKDTNASDWVNIFTRTGATTSDWEWLQESIVLINLNPFQVAFEVITNTGSSNPQSDIAIDDVTIEFIGKSRLY